jgi:probable phosphoglycerate mutase
MHLLLIRHALPLRVETPDGSPADPPLGETGREQARRLAAWLRDERIDRLYVSPLRRARETARPLEEDLGLEAVIEPGVTEFDPEADTYVPLEELKAEDPVAWRAMVQGGLHAHIDIEAFRAGVRKTLEGIIAEHPGGRVAVVCHGGVINAWASHVLGIASPLFFDPFYTSINRFLAAGSGERSVASLNETGHLFAGPRARTSL